MKRISLDLSRLITRPHESLSDSMAWFIDFFSWLRWSPEKRLGRFKTEYQENPIFRKIFIKNLNKVLLESSPINLLSLTGVSEDKGFFNEILDLTIKKILPEPPHNEDFNVGFRHIFKKKGDAELLVNLLEMREPDLLQNISLEVVTHYRASALEALLLLANHVSSIGLRHDVRKRLDNAEKISQSPFLILNHLIEHFIKDPSISCFDQIAKCRESVDQVFKHLDEFGVSLDLVHTLETLTNHLNRIEVLLQLLTETNSERIRALIIQFCSELVQRNASQETLSALISNNMRLLSRKIAERSGHSGEHYITRSSSEYQTMLFSAAGGGALVVVAVYIKFATTYAFTAPFFEGLLSSLNYAVNFLILQALHFTLATKQPSMTAATLAGKIKNDKSTKNLIDFIDEVVRLTRSQFAAICGNVGMAIPVSLLFCFIYVKLSGESLISAEYATKILHSLDPIESMTIPYAVFTGFLLWFSSICAGWIENWTVYRELPRAIAKHHNLTMLFGERFCLKLSIWFRRNISAIGGNISLAFLLGFTPIFGKFFGLPLDVRHVTLSSSSLTFAAFALWDSLDMLLLFKACLGIIFIGFLNLTASFAFALFVAAKARNVDLIWLRSLLYYTWLRLKQKPLDFILPPSKNF